MHRGREERRCSGDRARRRRCLQEAAAIDLAAELSHGLSLPPLLRLGCRFPPALVGLTRRRQLFDNRTDVRLSVIVRQSSPGVNEDFGLQTKAPRRSISGPRAAEVCGAEACRARPARGRTRPRVHDHARQGPDRHARLQRRAARDDPVGNSGSVGPHARDGTAHPTYARGARLCGAERRQFSLTPRVLELGFGYLSSQSWIDQALPLLKELSASVQESCSAAILQDTDIVYVARIPTQRIMSAALTVGSRLPAFEYLARPRAARLRRRARGLAQDQIAPHPALHDADHHRAQR